MDASCPARVRSRAALLSKRNTEGTIELPEMIETQQQQRQEQQLHETTFTMLHQEVQLANVKMA